MSVLGIAGGVVFCHFVLRPSPPKMEVASREKMAYPLPDKPSIAVLPFVNMSEDPKQEFLWEGIAEEIITALSKLPRLVVMVRSSAGRYCNRDSKDGNWGEGSLKPRHTRDGRLNFRSFNLRGP